jgi:hypothetical protein
MFVVITYQEGEGPCYCLDVETVYGPFTSELDARQFCNATFSPERELSIHPVREK